MKNFFKGIIAIIITGGLAVGVMYGYNYFFADKQSSGGTVQVFASSLSTERVSRSSVKDIVSASGVVNLKKDETVYSTASGVKVSEVLVEVGDHITAGQELVRYDVDSARKTLEKQIRQAEITLSDQKLSLQSMTLPPTESTVKNLQNAIDSAEKSLYDNNVTLENTLIKIENQLATIAKNEADIEKAEKDMESNKQLLSVGGITQSVYNDSLTARDKAVETRDTSLQTLEDLYRTKESNEMNIKTAEKNLQNAKDNLEDAYVVLKDESDKIKYEQQQNKIASSEMDLQELKDKLADLVEATYSTMDGTVTKVNVSRGQQVDGDTILLTVADFTQLIVKSNVSEYDVAKLELGQRVTMTSDGIEGVTYTGMIIKISPSASTQSAVSGTETVVPVEISVDNVDDKIKPGFNLDLEILVVDRQNVINVSTGALRRDRASGEYYVFIVVDELLKYTVVETGVYGDMTVEIVSGLKEGDVVITNPTDTMKDGMSADMFGGSAQMPANSAAGQNQNNAMQFNLGGMSGGGGASPMDAGGGMRAPMN